MTRSLILCFRISCVFLILLSPYMNASDPSQEIAQAQREIGSEGITDPDYKPALIRHIVLFRYKESVSKEEAEEIKQRFIALKDKCQRPDKKPYIVSIETGAQSSAEGVDHHFEQGFIVTFKSQGDRNYYVGSPIVTDRNYIDLAHDEFKNFVGPFLHEPIGETGVLVFDFAAEQ